MKRSQALAIVLGSLLTATAANAGWPGHNVSETRRGQETQNPRGEETQDPRGQDTQNPRGEDTQYPRGEETQNPRGQTAQAAHR